MDFGVANPALFHLLSAPDRQLQSPAAQSGRRILQSRVHRVAVTGRLRVSESAPSTSSRPPGPAPFTRCCQRHPLDATRAWPSHVPGRSGSNPHRRTRTLDDDPIATVVAFRAIAPQWRCSAKPNGTCWPNGSTAPSTPAERPVRSAASSRFRSVMNTPSNNVLEVRLTDERVAKYLEFGLLNPLCTCGKLSTDRPAKIGRAAQRRSC